MSEWKEIKLEEVLKFGNGKVKPNQEGKIPIYGGNGILGYGDDFNYDGETIIIGRVGAYCGSVYYENNPIWVSDNALSAKPKNDNNAKFLYYFLKHINLNQHAGGSSHPLVTQTLLNSLEFETCVNPIEQDAIASVLSSLDDKIDLLHRQNQTLEKMAETLFRQWFVEEVKEDWKDKKLGDFISIKHGFAFKGTYITSEPTNLILVTPGNFKIGGGFKFEKFKYYTSQDFPKNYIFHSGDLIVTMTDLSVDGNTLGYPAFVPENHASELYLHNQRVGKVEYRNELGKNFIYQLMRTEDYQWFVLSGASGTAIRHTSPTSICNYSFRIPPKSKIIEFELFANSLEEKKKMNQIQIRTLSTLRDTLLPKLMSGEVRVEI
ncbi:restriction endonuclease subunit S [Marivirga sp.]|uniref:restriction endonuclease subunit S n=1 Tax=Marivirga sp. TaxID=2018662 RepID=UPI0025D50539|nr:restriction endonuclease subunit S [Marivirga sp.]